MRLSYKFSSLALAVVAAAASFGAQAQSIDVRVTGTITPAACTPTLAGGGIIDYGNIPASSLNMTSFNVLPERAVPFSITCDAPTRISVRTIDNRAVSRVTEIQRAISPGYLARNNYGLGTASGANVGGYIMGMRQGTFIADGTNVFTIFTNNIAATPVPWVHTGSGAMNHDATSAISWSATQGGQPLAFSTLSGTLAVQAVLNRGDALPLSNDVPLDGLTTLEMVYL